MITNFLPGNLYKAKKKGFVLCPILRSLDNHLDCVVYAVGGGWWFEKCLLSVPERDDIFQCAFSVQSGKYLIFSAADVLSDQELSLFRFRLDMGPIERRC